MFRFRPGRLVVAALAGQVFVGCAADADPAEPHTDPALVETDSGAVADSDPPRDSDTDAIPCAPELSLGTVARADVGWDDEQFAELDGQGTLEVEFGPQGGFHVWVSVRSRCLEASVPVAVSVGSQLGVVVAGADDLFLPLDIRSRRCEPSEGWLVCTGVRPVFSVEPPTIGDPAFFTEGYTLRVATDGGDAVEVGVRLVDPRAVTAGR